MNERSTGTSDTDVARSVAFEGSKPRSRARQPRLLAANVTDEEYAQISAHARFAGVSIAEYLRRVAVSPLADYDTDYACIAKPLSDISYRLVRALDALERGQTDAVRGFIDEARGIATATLLPLSREHQRELRENDI